MNQRANINF